MAYPKIGFGILIAISAAITTSLTIDFPVSLIAPPALAQTTQARKAEADKLIEQGNRQINTSQYKAALQSYQEALQIYRKIKDRNGESRSLMGLGIAYSFFGQYPLAIDYYTQSLAIKREIGDRKGVSSSLNHLGNAYYSLGQYQKAIDYYTQSLAIAREIGDRKGVSGSLNNLGNAYNSLGQYQKAIDYFTQSLAIFRQIGDRKGESGSLNNLGSTYDSLGQYQKAIDYYTQSLAIKREIGDRKGESNSLNNLGSTYDFLGQYQKAIDYYTQSLTIFREIGDRLGEGSSLNNLGNAYNSLGQYQKAINYHTQSLAIAREIGERNGERSSLNSLGNAYKSLGQYQKATNYYTQSLAIAREIGDRLGESGSLNNLGNAYYSLRQYQKAINYHTQSLAIAREIGDRNGESRVLGNLGNTYRFLGQYQKAIDYHTQSLAIAREIAVREGVSNSLGNLGTVYSSLGQYQLAINYHTQSLAIKREIGDLEGEGRTLNNIALLLEKQNQLELAIVFYKQSVNATEAIRQDLKGLPKEQQQSYTDTVASTYRNLADLLLKRDRILEAQRVLDLLKVQELEDYLRNVRGSDNSAEGIANIAPEQPVVQGLNNILSQAIQLGQELAQLEKIPPAQRTTTQQQRIIELRKIQQQQTTDFIAFFNSPEVKTLVAQLRQTTGAQNINLEDARSLQDNLRKLPTSAVILYPFILEDRLELILVSADAPPIRRTVAVKRLQINQAIAKFRTALKDSNSDATTPGRQLYDWLIKPLENDLTQAQAKTIIYAPDAQLRYIPLSALYDGKQWLVQRFAINNITALSLTDLNTQPARQLQVFAGAFTSGSYSFKVGEQEFNFQGLPFAATEVNNLAATIPNTTKVLNGQFKPDTVYSMNDYSVVHLATHAAFVVGKPEDSFILFGDGGRVTLRDVETWNLPKVDLVVLSACETGLGGKLGNGEEILGLGYQLQRTGARAAIASLWSVDDGGTQALMNAFYGVLKQGNVTKAEALRLAQVDLIVNSKNSGQVRRGSIDVVPDPGATPRANDRLSHPYYWAPFILIGNGL